MGGEIVVESRPNRGSTFTFTAPLERDPDGATGSDLHDAIPQEDLDLLKGTHILSIDDNAVNTSYLVNLLKLLECDVAAARSGVDGIEMCKMAALREDPYEILLLDFAMPGMHGLEVAEIVTSSTTIMANKMRVIMLGSIDVHRSIAACPHVHGFTTKPIRRLPLIKMMIEQLKIKRGMLSTPTSRRPMALREQSPGRGSLMGSPVEQPNNTLSSNNLNAPKRPNPLSILYVEDNLINQKVIVSILSVWKCNVTTAVNGIVGYEERIAHKGKKSFDVILCDLHMPSCDGFQCVKLIRDWEEKNNVPKVSICAVTADAQPETRELCLSEDGGFDEFLAKPLRKNVLQDMIVKICGADRLGDVPAVGPSSQHPIFRPLEPEETPLNAPKVPSGGAHVLVIDDAPTMRLWLRTFLVDMGCDVSEASTGEDGVQFVRTSFETKDKDDGNPIELVFCDMRMPPGMGGIETARHIKMIPEASTLPIIGMTADDVTNAELNEARGAGMVSLISKPIGKTQLISYLVEHTTTALGGSERNLLAGKHSDDALLQTWNVPAALELCGNDPQFLESLLKDFAVDLAARREELSTSVQRKDCSRAAEIAHDVKGMASICNFKVLAKAASECQASASSSEYIELRSKSQVVMSEISKAIELAKEYNPTKW
jgi:CheY-like chemotaxis protein